jgi:hypothetical protein
MEVVPYRGITLEERPELLEQVNKLDREAWPEFMYHSRAWQCCWDVLLETYPQFQIVLLNGDETVAGVGHTVPARWNGKISDLPAGWDVLLERGVDATGSRDLFNVLAGLSVIVSAGHQGQGRSSEVLRSMKQVALHNSLDCVIVPVRPVLKSRYPLTPMERYIHWMRPDGKVFDPWLRTHLKVGGEIVGVAHESKVVTGTVAEWEEWTSMLFPETGDYIVPGALTPITIQCEKNEGRHAEPNVWLLHRM